MATKKPAPKKKAPAKQPKPAARRKPTAAPSLPPVQVSAAEPDNSSALITRVISSTVILFVLLIVVIIVNHRQAPVAPAPAPTPAPAPAAVEAQPELPPIQAEGPKMKADKKKPAHREDAKTAAKPKAAASVSAAMASDDDGRMVSATKPLKIRAWRKANAVATLDIFGAHNKLIAHLESEAGPAGWQTLAWDGQDAQGEKASGLVYVRASDPGLQDIVRMRIK